MIQYSLTRLEAGRRAKLMRATGYSAARVAQTTNVNGTPMYYITTHKRGCNCGACPTVQTDGYVR